MDKNTPKLNTPLSRLVDAFTEYKPYMQPGDLDSIALKSGNSRRTVEDYTNGKVLVIETGAKIFEVMRTIILERNKRVSELVG